MASHRSRQEHSHLLVHYLFPPHSYSYSVVFLFFAVLTRVNGNIRSLTDSNKAKLVRIQSGRPEAQLKLSEKEDIDIPVLTAKTPQNQIPSTNFERRTTRDNQFSYSECRPVAHLRNSDGRVWRTYGMLTVEKPQRRVPLRLFFTVSQVIICDLTHHKAVLDCSVHRNGKSIFKKPQRSQFSWKRAATVFFPKEAASNFLCLKLQSFHVFVFILTDI